MGFGAITPGPGGNHRLGQSLLATRESSQKARRQRCVTSSAEPLTPRLVTLRRDSYHPPHFTLKRKKKKNPATHTSVIYLVRTLKHRGVEYPAQSHTATGAVQRGESREGCKCSALQRPQACFPGPSGSTSDRPALPACGPVWEGSQGASELSARLHINLHFILTMVPQDRWRHSTVFFLS